MPAKMRVFQVAKLLKVEKSEILDALSDMDLPITSDLASLEDSVVEELKTLFKPKPASAKSKPAPVVAKPAVKKVKKPADAEPPPPGAQPAVQPSVTMSPAATSILGAAAAAAAPLHAATPATHAHPPVGPTLGTTGTYLRYDTTPPPAPSAPAAASPVSPSPQPPVWQRPQWPGRGPFAPGSRRPMRKKGVPAPPPTQQKPSKPEPPLPASVTLTEGVTVKELSDKLGRKSKDIIKKLLDKGAFVTINMPLDPKLALGICEEYGVEAKVISFEEEHSVEIAADTGGTLGPRPPVVTVMGHVDHGKTSLLDAIRVANVVASEHGGITQHIGAYHVPVHGRSVVFLDTPGHEAFTLMRARGARVTDIVVLVVAADDGVKPQTIEAIDHAKAAGVPIVVAINKIDKPGALPDRVKQQLSDRGLLAEDWGGDVVMVAVSAKQRTGLEQLLEMLLLVADLKELKAAPDRNATGTVLEARLDKTRGPVASFLVQDGTLRAGDAFIAGAVTGKVRALFDDSGAPVKSAGPSTPVEVLGLQDVPRAGDRFQVVADEREIRRIASIRQEKLRQESLLRSSRLTLDHLHQQIATGTVKELPVILKADVQGSVEVLAKSIADLSNEQVKLRIIHSGTGAITETDVLLASASNAVIVGFNVRPERSASELAEKEQVDVRLHSIIYDVTEEIRKAMTGLLEPTFKETYLGRAEVRETFRIPKIGVIAGCMAADGRITRTAEVRLLRDGVVVYEGKIASLKRFKDDASEVKAGFECGIGLDRFDDIKIGDVIEAFTMERVAPQLAV